jgi:hypothetical protein
MPDYGTYAGRDDVKTFAGQNLTADDAVIADVAVRASRLVDRLAQRHFYTKTATYRFDYQDVRILLLAPYDLLAITQLLNGDGDAIAVADYLLAPPNRLPKQWIELDRRTGALFVHDGEPSQAISIAGRWGWSEDTETSGATVQDNPLSASATTVNVSDGTKVKIQQTLLIESEQVYITAISVNALTVIRGVNGTTAASHIQGTAVSRFVYPAEIVQAALDLSVYLYKSKDAPFTTIGVAGFGTIELPGSIPGKVRDSLAPFRRVRIGV